MSRSRSISMRARTGWPSMRPPKCLARLRSDLDAVRTRSPSATLTPSRLAMQLPASAAGRSRPPARQVRRRLARRDATARARLGGPLMRKPVAASHGTRCCMGAPALIAGQRMQPGHRGEQPGSGDFLRPSPEPESCIAFEQARADVARAHGLGAEDLPEEASVRPHTLDFGRLERALQSLDGAESIRCPGNDLGNHRIVMHRDFVALLDARIDAHVFLPRPETAAVPVGPSTAGNPVPDLPRTGALRRRGRAAKFAIARAATVRRRRRGIATRRGRAP